jgi:hypothetical protein
MSFHPSPLLSSPSNHTAWWLCLQIGSAWTFEHALHAEEEEMLMQQENCSAAQQKRNQKDKSHTNQARHTRSQLVLFHQVFFMCAGALQT